MKRILVFLPKGGGEAAMNSHVCVLCLGLEIGLGRLKTLEPGQLQVELWSRPERVRIGFGLKVEFMYFLS